VMSSRLPIGVATRYSFGPGALAPLEGVFASAVADFMAKVYHLR
jgi:hypothetical protein